MPLSYQFVGLFIAQVLPPGNTGFCFLNTLFLILVQFNGFGRFIFAIQQTFCHEQQLLIIDILDAFVKKTF